MLMVEHTGSQDNSNIEQEAFLCFRLLPASAARLVVSVTTAPPSGLTLLFNWVIMTPQLAPPRIVSKDEATNQSAPSAVDALEANGDVSDSGSSRHRY